MSILLTSTNRKQGTMELLLFTPGFSSTAIPLFVSLNIPLNRLNFLPPYPERERERVSQMSVLATPEVMPRVQD